MSATRRHNSTQRVIISPKSGKMTFVGRHDYVDPAVRFDAQGFEISFRVEGASTVQIAMAQQISGPGGWYFQPHYEDVYEDACFVSPQPEFLEGTNTGRSSEAMQPFGSQPHHFLVYVDGVPQIKPWQTNRKCTHCTFDTSEAGSGQVFEYTIARGLKRWKSYQIRIVKTSEPDLSTYPVAPNWLSLHALILDQGDAHKAYRKERTQHKIEFIGDSWMAGYCNGCEGGLCTEGMNKGSYQSGQDPGLWRWGSYALAWPYLLCEDLNADCHSTVLSGIGLHCTSHPGGDPNDCSGDQTLPLFWQRTLATDESSQWDFNVWTPDVLAVLASINEHFEDPMRDKEAVLKTYDNFLDSVYERYPDVHVLVICLDSYTAMSMCNRLKRRVHKKKNSGAKVDLLDAFHDIPGLDNQKQCCAHPDAEAHKVIKNYVAEEMRRIMGWQDAPWHSKAHLAVP